VGLAIAFDGSWASARHLLTVLALTIVLMLGAIVVARADFDWSAPTSWIFTGGMTGILLLIGYAPRYAEAMNAPEYHFVTHWRVPGTVDDVADVLSDATDLPRWWPAVYLDVVETKPGDEDGIGQEVALHTRGWLPYTLRWHFRVTESDFPHRFALESWGDFVGRGEWRLRQDGHHVVVTYDWRVSPRSRCSAPSRSCSGPCSPPTTAGPWPAARRACAGSWPAGTRRAHRRRRCTRANPRFGHRRERLH
jgi:hypothetical protein